jgi:secondary thiamine-phosphate synthase enzyme
MIELVIKTKQKREIVDITDKVNSEIKKLGKKDGLLNLFLIHTTAALTTADLDPGGTDKDYLEAFEKLIPKINFRHPHNPAHMPDHILSSLIGTSLTIPVKSEKLVLGTWQRIVLIEFDGPRERNIIISISC